MVAQESILKSLGATEKIFQWHGDTFNIPAGAVHLAASPLCVNQAFSYGEKIYGLQFHLEIDEAMILGWLKVPENQREIAKLRGDANPDHMHGATARHIRSCTNSAIRRSANYRLIPVWKDPLPANELNFPFPDA